MPILSARIRFIVGALALALIVAVAAPASAQQRNPDSSVNPTASSVQEDQLLNELNRISGRCTHPRPEGLHHRAAGRPRLASLPRGDAALDRRHLDPRHARAAGGVLSDPRHGAHRSRPLRPRAGALLRLRAPRALDDGDLLHRSRHLRPQHHLRQAVAAAADRAGGLHHVVAVGEIRAQLSELPVHARRVH